MDKIYDRAWKLLSDPSKWTKETLARDIHGKPVLPCEKTAVSWCVNGALMKVYGLDHTKTLRWATHHARAEKVFDLNPKYVALQHEVGFIPYWNNDTATHAEIVEALKKYDL
jgi:hypothetical protein